MCKQKERGRERQRDRATGWTAEGVACGGGGVLVAGRLGLGLGKKSKKLNATFWNEEGGFDLNFVFLFTLAVVYHILPDAS